MLLTLVGYLPEKQAEQNPSGLSKGMNSLPSFECNRKITEGFVKLLRVFGLRAARLQKAF